MSKYAVALALVVGMSGLGLTGCGGGGAPEVVETSEKGGALPPEQQQSYEEAMKQKQGPGN